MIDQTAATTLILFLESRFGTRKRVRVRFSNRSNARGWYYPNEIRLGKHTSNWIVCHEYAHHLDRLVNRPGRTQGLEARSVARKLRDDHEGHSESFYYNLRRIIEATGIDYPWKKEYRQILRWAKRDGLC